MLNLIKFAVSMDYIKIFNSKRAIISMFLQLLRTGY